MPRLRNRPVLEVGRVDVLSLNDTASADVANDIERAVGRTRISDEDFVCNCLHRFNASADVPPLILAWDEHRKLCRHDKFPRCRRGDGRRECALGGVAKLLSTTAAANFSQKSSARTEFQKNSSDCLLARPGSETRPLLLPLIAQWSAKSRN